MYFMSDTKTIYGNSVSAIQKSSYHKSEHKQVCSKDKREVKYAPKFKSDKTWSIYPSKLEKIEKRVELTSYKGVGG